MNEIGASSGGIISAEDSAYIDAELSASKLCTALTEMLASVPLRIKAQKLAITACEAATELNPYFRFYPVLDERHKPHEKLITVHFMDRQ